MAEVAVDYDPFSSGSAGGAGRSRETPVDYDPFSEASAAPTAGTAQSAIGEQSAAAHAAMERRASQTLPETMRGFLGEAQERTGRGVAELTGEAPREQISPGVTQGQWTPGRGVAIKPWGAPAPGTEVSRARQIAGGMADIAGGGMGTLTAPLKTFPGVPIERATGVPVETQVELLGAAGTMAPGLGSLFREGVRTPVWRRPQTPPYTPAAAPVGPSGPPPEATPRPELDPNVRVMPSDVAHSYRSEVGAAGGPDVLAEMSPEARSRLQDIFNETGHNEHTVEQRIDEMSPHETLGEFDPNLQGHMEGIQSRPGAAQTEIAQTLRQRNVETRERILNEANEAFGTYTNQRAWQNEIRDAQKRASQPFWQRFNNLVITPTPALEQLLPRLDAAGALRAANRSLRVEGLPESMGFPEGAAAGEQTQIPTARAFQLAKEHLDDKIGAAISAGERNEARRLTGLKRALVDSIDNHPDANIAGVWRDARNSWATYADLLNARKIGEGLLSSKLGTEEAAEILGDLSDQQRRAAMMGARARIEQIAGGSRSRVESRLINELLAENNRTKIGALLNDQGRADNLFNAIEAEQRMRQAVADTVGNSRTARRQAFGAQWDAPETNLIERAGKIAGAVAHPKVAVAKWVGKKLDTRAEAEASRIREEVGRALVTQGPQRDAILRQLAVDASRRGFASGGGVGEVTQPAAILAQAANAIARGAPPHAVVERLGELGVDPSELVADLHAAGLHFLPRAAGGGAGGAGEDALYNDVRNRAKGGRAEAQPRPRVRGELANKKSHEEVGYVAETTRPKQVCSLCRAFLTLPDDGSACRRVRDISPGGHCKLFSRKTFSEEDVRRAFHHTIAKGVPRDELLRRMRHRGIPIPAEI